MVEKKTTEKAASKKAEHPPYEAMIKSAILALKERKGSSRQALKKYILANYNVSAGTHFDQQVSAAIKRGAAKNLFTLPKGLSGTVKLSKPEKKVAVDKKEKEAKPGAAEKKTTAKKTTSAAKKTAAGKKAAASTPAKKQPTRQKTASKEKVKAPRKKSTTASRAITKASTASAGTTSRRRPAAKA